MVHITNKIKYYILHKYTRGLVVVVVLLQPWGFGDIIVGSNLGAIIFYFSLAIFPHHAKFEFHNMKISNEISGV